LVQSTLSDQCRLHATGCESSPRAAGEKRGLTD
jgi:hypothetical protein